MTEERIAFLSKNDSTRRQMIVRESRGPANVSGSPGRPSFITRPPLSLSQITLIHHPLTTWVRQISMSRELRETDPVFREWWWELRVGSAQSVWAYRVTWLVTNLRKSGGEEVIGSGHYDGRYWAIGWYMHNPGKTMKILFSFWAYK